MNNQRSTINNESLIRDHPLDLRRIRIAHQDSLSQLLLTLVRLGGEHMAQMRVPAFHLPLGSFLEALGGAFVCFQFRHKFSIALRSQRSALSTEMSQLLSISK